MIRIRVYPDPNSIGARRNRQRKQAARLKQAQLRRQRFAAHQLQRAYTSPFSARTPLWAPGTWGLSRLLPLTSWQSPFTSSLFGSLPYLGYGGASWNTTPAWSGYRQPPYPTSSLYGAAYCQPRGW